MRKLFASLLALNLVSMPLLACAAQPKPAQAQQSKYEKTTKRIKPKFRKQEYSFVQQHGGTIATAAAMAAAASVAAAAYGAHVLKNTHIYIEPYYGDDHFNSYRYKDDKLTPVDDVVDLPSSGSDIEAFDTEVEPMDELDDDGITTVNENNEPHDTPDLLEPEENTIFLNRVLSWCKNNLWTPVLNYWPENPLRKALGGVMTLGGTVNVCKWETEDVENDIIAEIQNSFKDGINLNWDDFMPPETAIREHALRENWCLPPGFSYNESPGEPLDRIPDARGQLTPFFESPLNELISYGVDNNDEIHRATITAVTSVLTANAPHRRLRDRIQRGLNAVAMALGTLLLLLP